MMLIKKNARKVGKNKLFALKVVKVLIAVGLFKEQGWCFHMHGISLKQYNLTPNEKCL